MVVIGVLLILSVIVFAGGYLTALGFLLGGVHPKRATLAAGIGSTSLVLGWVFVILGGITPLAGGPIEHLVGYFLLFAVVVGTWGLIFHSWTRWPHTHPVEI